MERHLKVTMYLEELKSKRWRLALGGGRPSQACRSILAPFAAFDTEDAR